MTKGVTADGKPPILFSTVEPASNTARFCRTQEGSHREADLAARQCWLENMINQIPDYIYAKDLEGRFLFANQAIVANNGLSRLEDLVGRTDFDFLPKEVAQVATDVERRVAETGQPHSGAKSWRFAAKANDG